MPRFPFLVALLVAASPSLAQPNRVGVYTYSRDSIGGFDDDRLDTFRRELGKYAGDLIEVAYARESAGVAVQFLGPGRLAVELDSKGDAVRHLWTPDEEASEMWAVVRIRGFSKEFSVDGSGGRDLSRLAKDVSEWLKRNSTAIRETLHREPPGG